jgi:dTDP-4-amino-4,6-dideoxygalactose transaminase
MTINDLERHKSGKIIIEEYPEIGFNYRMTDIQAAVGIKQLEKLDWLIQERRKLAFNYHERLKHCKNIELPIEESGYSSNYQSYAITLKKSSPINRDDLMQKLLDAGIASRRGIMTAHSEKAYKHYNISLPVTELLSGMSFLLPLYVGMKEEEQKLIIEHFLDLV